MWILGDTEIQKQSAWHELGVCLSLEKKRLKIQENPSVAVCKGNKRLQTFQNSFFFVNSGFHHKTNFCPEILKSEFLKKQMKANVCENCTCHQVNKTKTRIVKLLLRAFIQDSGDGRFMV